jgi:hypothetical protein
MDHSSDYYGFCLWYNFIRKDKRQKRIFWWFAAKEMNSFLHNILILGRNVMRINKGTCGKHSELFEEMETLSSNLKV